MDAAKLKQVEERAKGMHESLVIGSRIFESQKIRSEFVKAGDVADAICNYCKGVETDLVIVGGRGMGH
jgi:nucleotide-binding universal stress UspA family protein